MFHGYTMVLIGELQVAHIHVLPSPYSPDRGPIIPPYEPEYMPAPLGPPGGLDFFAQTQGPSQDPRYSPGTSGRMGPSTGSLTGDGDDDDGDQYFMDDNS